MIVLLVFSFMALFLTFLECKGSFPHGFKWGMILVTIIAAIHYNFGSDYWEYYDHYINALDNSLSDILSGELSYKGENGWLLLMYILKPLGISGFFVLVALIAIFQGVVVYKLITTYLPKQWILFAFFIYLFNLSLYVGSMSGIRQHLAMTIIACSIPLILKKKIFPSILIIFAASTIHVSSLVFLPFAFWGFVPIKNTRYLVVIFTTLYIVSLIGSSLSATIVNKFLTLEKFEHYETYINEENTFLGWSYYLVQLFLFIVTLVYLYNNYNDETKKRLVSLVAAGMTLLPILASAHNGARLFYYFEFISIVSIPIAYSTIKNKSMRFLLTILYSLYLVYAYNLYFHSELRYSSTYFYHSILDLI